MSKWRPTESGCLYVIPDIHGASGLLDKITARILPLRKNNGVQDKIVFLGDYIDRGGDTPGVLDRLIKIRGKYKDNVIFLIGNHELLMFQALGWMERKENSYFMWIRNGGYETISQYAKRAGIKDDPLSLNPSRISSLIPDDHKRFLMGGLSSHYRQDEYLFVHGGCDPYHTEELDNKGIWSPVMNKFVPHDFEALCWNRTLCYEVMNRVKNGDKLDWNDIIITGHNKRIFQCRPVITDKFMMLDCGSPKKLLIVELNSMEAFMAYVDKKRLLKYELKELIYEC